MAIHYRHTQVAWFVIVLAVPAVVLAAALAFRDSVAAGLLVGAVTTFLAFSLSSLTTSVSDDAVRVWFGVGLVRRRIPLDQITTARAVRNHWIYGWGVRVIPHGWLWNLSGLGGVELCLANGRRFRIGTDEPERLAAAIQGALRRR